MSALDTTDQSHNNFNSAECNNHVNTNNKSDGTGNEVIEAHTTTSQYNVLPSFIDLTPNNEATVTTSIDETLRNSLVMENGEPLPTTNDSNTGEEMLNDNTLPSVPTEMSGSAHDDADICDSVSEGEILSISEGEILSDDEEGGPHITESHDSQQEDVKCDYNVSSHRSASISPHGDQSQHQGNQRDHHDQGCHLSDRYSKVMTSKLHNHVSSKHEGNTRSNSKPDQSHDHNGSHDSSKTYHSSRKPHQSLHHKLGGSHDLSKRLDLSSSKPSKRLTHGSSSKLHRSSGVSHEPSKRLHHSSSGSHEPSRRSHCNLSVHDSTKTLHCTSSGLHDPSKMFHHTSGTFHESSKRLHHISSGSHDSSTTKQCTSCDLHNSSRRSSESHDSLKMSNEVNDSSRRVRHRSSESHNSSRTLHHNSFQSTQHSSRPDQKRTVDRTPGAIRPKHHYSNHDRDTPSKRKR